MATYYQARDGRKFNTEREAIAYNTALSGLSEENNGKYYEAIVYYTDAIDSFPHYPYTNDLHYAYLMRARTYLKIGDWEKAETDVEGVLNYGRNGGVIYGEKEAL